MRERGVWLPAVIVAAVLVLIGLAGWYALRWFDDGFDDSHVEEDVDGARDIAESMGVQLDRNTIQYGEVTSQFQGSSSASVAANIGDLESRDELVRRSAAPGPRHHIAG